MKDYFEQLLKLCDEAIEKDEVPVAALIVKDDRVIATSFNNRISNKSVLNHAEIIAIETASVMLGDWRLDGCDLYVTLKPCDMCTEVIKAARIKNIYYLADKLDLKKNMIKQILKNAILNLKIYPTNI